MENDSPNLFDSEPLSVKLTVAAEADDVLTELIEEINSDSVPMISEQNVNLNCKHLSVKSTVAAEADDILTELTEEINTESAPMIVEQNVDDVDNEMDSDFVQTDVQEYHTDEEDDVADELTPADDSLDQSTEQPNADSPMIKGKDGHKGLPTNRVKYIMKMDPDVNIVAGEAVFLVTKATEAFVGLLAQHCHKAMVSSNKKTLQKKHIDAAIEDNVPLEFLEGALDW